MASCHDCSEGGVAVALAEMAIASDLGVEADLSGVQRSAPIHRPDALAFGEAPSRFVVAVAPEHGAAFEQTLAGLPMAAIGQVQGEDAGPARLRIFGDAGVTLVDATVAAATRAFCGADSPLTAHHRRAP